MKQLFYVLVLSLFVSCNSTYKEESKSENKEELVMYVPSELTLLMEEIYKNNELLKTQIVNGENLAQFPDNFLKIHTAQMTDRFERDTTFEVLAKKFIENQKLIYSSISENRREKFNNTINACIACHQNTCTGPIPRIKKLLIK